MSNKWYQSRILVESLTTSRFMVSSNSLFLEGNSIHRPPIFNDEGYHYWKTRMQIFIDAIDLNIWEAIQIGPHIPTIVDVGTSTTTQNLEISGQKKIGEESSMISKPKTSSLQP